MTGQRTQLEREWQARAYQVMNQVITVEPLVADVLAAAYAKDGRAFVRLSKQVFPRIPLEDRLKLLVTLRPGDQELEAAIQRMRTLVK